MSIPPELAQLQQQFLHAVNTTDTALLNAIAPHARLTLTAQLQIYRQNTQLTRCKTLQTIYPILHTILGEECFQALAQHYIAAHPAKHGNLNQYGDQLATYITDPPHAFQALHDLPYLSDLAQLEYLVHQAYYAPDATIFPSAVFNQLTATQQTQIQLQLAPDIGLLRTDWPLLACWQHWQQHHTLPATLVGTQTTQFLCIHRADLQPTVSAITPEAYQLFSYLPDMTLAELAKHPELANRMSLITNYIQCGWICGFRTE